MSPYRYRLKIKISLNSNIELRIPEMSKYLRNKIASMLENWQQSTKRGCNSPRLVAELKKEQTSNRVGQALAQSLARALALALAYQNIGSPPKNRLNPI